MKKLFFTLSIIAALTAQASVLERPAGFRIGQRMTIRPYVSLFYTWDSNVDSSTSQTSDSSFNIMPGFTFTYKANNWSLEGGAYYQYHAYAKNAAQLNQHSWGENLAFNWSNSKNGGRGWSLVLRESFQQIAQDDDMTNDGGRGIGRDRWQLQVAGVLQRRFTDRWHADIDASYYYIDYKNNETKYAPLYGWQRWTAGGQIGYAASKWTDILLMANYQGYIQNNNDYQGSDAVYSQKLSQNSQGVTVHLGVGTYATERISYRVSGGYSYFSYADGASKAGGFTYAVSGQWRMADRWNMMILASSYFQPSETEYGSLQRTDSISWGLAHSMIRNKLTATLDLTYRHEKREYVDNFSTYAYSSDYADDIITARLGLNYAINRFVSLFGNCEYQRAFYDRTTYGQGSSSWDYNRWRLSVGLRLTY